MEDDAIFRNRILIDEKLLKRFSKRAVTLLISLESLPESQRSGQINLLLSELKTYELMLKKVDRMIAVNEQDIQTYRSKRNEIDNDIIQQQEAVKSLKERLDLEIVQRKNKEEYDKLADQILKFPSREELSTEIKNFDEEAQKIVSEQHQIEQLIAKHRESVSTTFNSLNQIIESISDDLKSLSYK